MVIISLHPNEFSIKTGKYGLLKFTCLNGSDLFYLFDNSDIQDPMTFAKMLSAFTVINTDKSKTERAKRRKYFPLYILKNDELNQFCKEFINHHRFLIGKKDSYVQNNETKEQAIESIEAFYVKIKWPKSQIKKLFKAWKYYSEAKMQERNKLNNRLLDAEEKNYKLLKEYTNILRKINWAPIFCLAYSQIRQIVDEYQKHGNENKQNFQHELTKAFESYFNEEYINELLEKWKKNKKLEKRINILNDAIFAHNNGKYTLSIPVLLTQIEGVMREYHSYDLGQHFSQYIDKSLMKKYKDIPINIFEFDNEVKRYLKNIVFKNMVNITIKDEILNRNNILHGIDTNYSKKKYSIQIILILEYILNTLLNTDDVNE